MEGRRLWLKKFLGGVLGSFGIVSGASALSRGLTEEETHALARSIAESGEDALSDCPNTYCPGTYCANCYQRCHFSCGTYTPSSWDVERELI